MQQGHSLGVLCRYKVSIWSVEREVDFHLVDDLKGGTGEAASGKKSRMRGHLHGKETRRAGATMPMNKPFSGLITQYEMAVRMWGAVWQY
jgi:hypothetical protein